MKKKCYVILKEGVGPNPTLVVHAGFFCEGPLFAATVERHLS